MSLPTKVLSVLVETGMEKSVISRPISTVLCTEISYSLYLRFSIRALYSSQISCISDSEGAAVVVGFAVVG